MGLLNGLEKVVDPTKADTVTLASLSHDPQVRKEVMVSSDLLRALACRICFFVSCELVTSCWGVASRLRSIVLLPVDCIRYTHDIQHAH